MSLEAELEPRPPRRLPRLAVLALWVSCAVGLLQVMLTAGLWTSQTARLHPRPCTPDNEGMWSIGIFRGPSPFDLKPLELLTPRGNTPSAWPVANPVYTCAHVTDVPSSFVADPFLWVNPKNEKEVHMFYETKSLHNMQGDIGAAVSKDGGLTFQHAGVVLDESWHLSYPFVFEHDGTMYMMPEGSKSGTLRLYQASAPPLLFSWHLDRVLIDQPLIDASLVLPQPASVANSDGRWYLFASNRNQKSSKGCRELEIWHSNSLDGTWELHPASPVRQWVQGSRMAGRPIVVNGQLYRFAQDCGATYGASVRAFRVGTLNATHFAEEEVPLGFDPASGRRGEGAAWNSVRHHHLDAHQLSTGEWIAAMDGDRYVSDYITQRWLGRLAFYLPALVALAAVVLLMRHCAQRVNLAAAIAGPFTKLLSGLPHALAQRLKAQPAASAAGFNQGLQGKDVEMQGLLSGGPSISAAVAKTGPKGKPQRRGQLVGSILSGLPGSLPACDASLQQPRRCLLGGSLYQLLAGALLAGFLAWLLFLFVFFNMKPQMLAGILGYLDAAGGSKDPILIDNQASKFTLLVMSYSARMLTLKTFVQHYQTCASVGEIVVVWNKGDPPDPDTDMGPAQVPVRVRVEKQNSMNNRFQPDPTIKNRAVLMLDDDILMPCSDIERGFARWRQHPERITGYYARLLEGNPPQYQCTHCERHTYDSGQYNVILAGASFLDRELVFDAYFSPENKAGRDYVDRVFNCDDLLLNYLMAHKLKGHQYVEWVRPSKRFDVGRLTSKRLSTGNFGPVRHNCTRDFAQMFDNPLLNKAYDLDFEGMGKPWCPSGIGCMFI